MTAILTALGLAKVGWQFITGPSMRVYLWAALGMIILIALGSAVMIHQRAVHNALEQAGRVAELAERAKWQEKERLADVAREQERRRAQVRVDALEAEAASLQARVDAQEAELEQAIKSSENGESGSTGALDGPGNATGTGGAPPGSRHVLPRDLVRELGRQGR